MLQKSLVGIRTRPLLRLLTRFHHKLNKPAEKPAPKAAQDVKKYLESSIEYTDILDRIPKYLLRKYKNPESMYLINQKTAKEIVSIIDSHITKETPIVEVNPGFGFLSNELLESRNNQVYLYETSNQFNQFLEKLKEKYPEKVSIKIADFFGMWKAAFQDKMDEGNRINELLGDLATDDNERILSIVGAMPSLSFVKHLINTIIFHNTTSRLGKPDLFICMPGHHYEFLTDSSIQLSKYKAVPALFQLLFDYKILAKVPKVHFLPWTYPVEAKKTTMMDDYCLYLVNIKLKETLPCPPTYLPLLWYFFKPHTFSKSTRVIPMIEQWIPGCGVWLITGQDPPDTNKLTAPGPDDAPLPHMNIFTEFGDLSLSQKMTVFKRFVSWPEFEQCQFRSTMENNLPKFATQLDDEDKSISHIDDIEHSDTEADPENI